MRLVEPWIKVENFDGVKIMKRIERACRTCYRSEDKISEESYKNLLTNCLNRGHESVLEHEKITVRIYRGSSTPDGCRTGGMPRRFPDASGASHASVRRADRSVPSSAVQTVHPDRSPAAA